MIAICSVQTCYWPWHLCKKKNAYGNCLCLSGHELAAVIVARHLSPSDETVVHENGDGQTSSDTDSEPVGKRPTKRLKVCVKSCVACCEYSMIFVSIHGNDMQNHVSKRLSLLVHI